MDTWVQTAAKKFSMLLLLSSEHVCINLQPLYPDPAVNVINIKLLNMMSTSFKYKRVCIKFTYHVKQSLKKN